MTSPDAPHPSADRLEPQESASGPTARLSPWQARLLRRATPVDVAYGVAVVAFAVLTLWSGNAAARHLSPAGARSVSALLDELELPRVLPNAPLVDDDGGETTFWSLTTAPRTIVAFYAPWCGPCQEELPTLVNGTAAHPERLAVVVGRDEEPVEVRQQLDNLGLKNLRFHVDVTGQLHAGGRVTALPTTFVVGRMGRVQERVVGHSEFRLQMILWETVGSLDHGD